MAKEKIEIVSCLQKGTTKKGNPYFTVTLKDGRTATCFDQKIAQTLNAEIEVLIDSKEWEGVTQYVVNPVNENRRPGGGGFNLEFNQRKTALDCAVASIPPALNNGAEILVRADKFLEWMKKQ